MSKYFTVRTPLTITIGDKAHTFYIRELGYLRFMELNESIGTGKAANERGLAIMNAVCLAAIEEEDGSPSYTEEEWRHEIRTVVTQLAKAAMKAQGVDMDKVPDESFTEEQIEGNAGPSRKSGTNSPSTSAALSAS